MSTFEQPHLGAAEVLQRDAALLGLTEEGLEKTITLPDLTLDQIGDGVVAVRLGAQGDREARPSLNEFSTARCAHYVVAGDPTMLGVLPADRQIDCDMRLIAVGATTGWQAIDDPNPGYGRETIVKPSEKIAVFVRSGVSIAPNDLFAAIRSRYGYGDRSLREPESPFAGHHFNDQYRPTATQQPALPLVRKQYGEQLANMLRSSPIPRPAAAALTQATVALAA